MSRKANKKQPVLKLSKKHWESIYKILIILILLYFLSKYKFLIIILAFEILDFLKVYMRQSLNYFPIEFRFIFGIAASYYYHPIYGVIIFCIGIVNRAIMLKIEIMDIIKAVRHIPLFYLVYFFKGHNFFTLAMLALTLNYIMKYTLNIAHDRKGYDDIIYLVINYSTATVLFYFIYVIYTYLRFLV
jgi:hypothetical protein